MHKYPTLVKIESKIWSDKPVHNSLRRRHTIINKMVGTSIVVTIVKGVNHHSVIILLA